MVRLLLLAGFCFAALVTTLGQTADVCSAFSACGEGSTCTCTKGCPGDGGGIVGGKKFCSGQDQCGENEICLLGRCEDPCSGRCGANTVCKAINRGALCRCLPGYKGNPLTGCERDKYITCDRNAICGSANACVGQVCIDPCTIVSCPSDTECHVVDHRVSCIPKPIVKPQCTQQFHCSGETICINERCVDPCSDDICGKGAECTVSNHRVVCTFIPKIKTCQKDGDCPSNLQCRAGKCKDTCNKFDCGKGAKCVVVNNVLTCWREPPEKGCDSDQKCAGDRACVNRDCVNPCDNIVCNGGTCRVFDHKATCIGIGGECTSHETCPTDRQCIGGKCSDPCAANVCQEKDICLVKDHVTSCITDDPDPSDCSTNGGCSSNKKCSGGKCIDPCSFITCAGNYLCLTQDHVARCIPKKDECLSHSECPSDKTCHQGKCIDPCLSKVCGENALCQVNDHKIICGNLPPPQCESGKDCEKDMLCAKGKCIDPCKNFYCPDNTTCQIDGNGVKCRQIPEGRALCTRNADCSTTKRCQYGECQDPCEMPYCGTKGICVVVNHTPICVETPPPPPPPPECKLNEDCTKTQICSDDGKCTDPCGENPCGELNCVVENHVVTCKHKEPPAECDATKKCPDGSTCVESKCVDACEIKACGANSVCTIVNGAASCKCSPGFTGDGETGCKEEIVVPGTWGYNIGNCSGNTFPQFPKKKKYYAVANHKTNWYGALHYCTAHGRRLAVVENKEENEQILQEIERVNTAKTNYFWTSGTTNGFPSRWHWMTTGLPIVNYTNWHSPPGSGCLAYQHLANVYKWQYVGCTILYNFICEDYE